MPLGSHRTEAHLTGGLALAVVLVLCLLLAGCGTKTASSASVTTAPSVVTDFISSTTTVSSLPQETTETSFVASTPDLDKLVAAWKAHGIQVIAVTTKPGDASHVIVKVPEATVAGPNGVFADHELERQAVLLVLHDRLPFKWLEVVTVDAQGKESPYESSTLAGIVEQWQWTTPLMGEATLDAKLQALVKDSAEKTGVGLTSSLFAAPADGRTLDVAVTLTKDSADQLNAFLEDLVPPVQALNRQGGHLALLNLSVNDSADSPALRSVQDFQLGSTADWWSGQRYMPYWANQPPSPTTSP